MQNGTYHLGLYEKAMPANLSFAEMLDETARAGFDTLEISIDESDSRLARIDWDAAERRQVLKSSLDAGVPIATMCLSGHRKYPLGSHDPDLRRRSLDIFQKAMRLGDVLGVRIIQLAGYDVYYEDGDADTAKWFGENLAVCAELAAREGMLLGFETMETPFMDTVGKAMRWVDLIGSPYLGVFPDIGNLKNASVKYGTSLLDDIRLGAGHTFAAHLKETRPGVYRDMRFGCGHTEYGPCIEALWTMGVRRFTGEFWYLGQADFRKDLGDASAFLRGKLDKHV